MADIFDDLDNLRLRGTEGIRTEPVELESVRALRAAKGSRVKRLYYPSIEVAELPAWYRAHPAAVPIMMECRRLATMGNAPPYTFGPNRLVAFGMPRRARDRALVALERAGFVRLERRRNSLARIWPVARPKSQRANGQPDQSPGQ